MTESPSNFFAEFSDALLLSFLRHSVTRDRGLIDHARRFPPPLSAINAVLHRQWEAALQATATCRQKYPNIQYG
jgi:hypothetical protein